jgi:hypothetical protein
VKLAGNRVILYLSEEGKEFLDRTADVPSPNPVAVEVAETDDMGMWVRARREDFPEWVLIIRWEFILGIEVQEKKNNVFGLTG